MPAGVDLDAVAEQASYVGSPEHKDVPSPAGPPAFRADASRCPPEIAREWKRITGWLRAAIRQGYTGEFWEGHSPPFPRYVWHRREGTVFEGRLVNRELGQYKGYPLERSEWPADFEAIHAAS